MAAAVGFILTAAQIAQAESERQRQERHRRQKELEERANALAAQRIAIGEIQLQQVAEADAAAVEIETNRRAALQAKGTAQAAAGEIGAFGLSYEGLINDFNRQQAEFEASVYTNLEIKRQFANLSLQSAELDAQARIINAQTPRTPRPNYANYAISGIDTGLTVHRALNYGSGQRGGG